ncbi:MAG: xanthine dehydrogenase family protein molybdopterin-binding subunit [Deltaproteobacteria bacterium]|nr:xanthine dehydrogenase family protein molybdopterin-binding subunit [Deltaproteobacteria bacterium]
MNYVGQSLLPLDGREKVTGGTAYAVHANWPGMVYGKILRSAFPHARIARLDVSRAERLPGVSGVLTGSDLARWQNPYFGAVIRDQPIVAIDKVHFIGDPVAAVAAETPEIAADALELIDVEYEELPAVHDAKEAMLEHAPVVHDRVVRSLALFDPAHVPIATGQNVCGYFRLRKGDISLAFKQADEIFENVYFTAPTQHCAFEPHTALARWAGDKLEVWSSTQNPSVVKAELAELFSLPISNIRVVAPPLGSGFGSKLFLKVEPLAVALAAKVGRPVKIVLDREEVFLTLTEPGTWIRIKTAVLRDGTLLGREMEVILDTGAYADITPRLARGLGLVAPGPYKISNVSVDVYAVYTNKAPAGALRGVIGRQACWAYEQEMDQIAARIGMDPVELRLKNFLHDGDKMHAGETVEAFPLEACLKRVRDALDWNAGSVIIDEEKNKVRAKGVACFVKHTMTPAFSLTDLRLEEDGSLAVHVGSVEMGQGAATVLKQMAADAMNLPIERVSIIMGDTNNAPYDQGTNSSRTTFHMGRAIVSGSERLRAELLAHAARLLEVSEQDLEIREGRVIARGAPARGLSFGDIVTRVSARGGSLSVSGISKSEAALDQKTGQGKGSTYYFTGAGGCEVEIDRETGVARVLRYVAANNVGTAINPMICTAQIEGSVAGGISQTLFEEMRWERGQLVNPNLADYSLLTSWEAPPVEVVLVESPHGAGPFGAVGAGEPAIVPTSAAIGNAVARALGIRLFSLPVKPDEILKALAEK